jgi:hypothetical protein
MSLFSFFLLCFFLFFLLSLVISHTRFNGSRLLRRRPSSCCRCRCR